MPGDNKRGRLLLPTKGIQVLLVQSDVFLARPKLYIPNAKRWNIRTGTNVVLVYFVASSSTSLFVNSSSGCLARIRLFVLYIISPELGMQLRERVSIGDLDPLAIVLKAVYPSRVTYQIRHQHRS